MRHLIENSSQESVVEKKHVTSSASFVRDLLLLAFVNAVYFIQRDRVSPIYFLNDLVTVTTNAS